MLPLGLALGSAFEMYVLSAARPGLFPGEPGFRWISWPTVAIALWLVSILYWVFRSMQLMIARGLFGPRQRFHLPYAVVRADHPPFYYGDPEHLSIFEDRLRHILMDPGLPPAERHRLMRRYYRMAAELGYAPAMRRESEEEEED
jgi:hypothetical protein